jgi:hypothetical protein
MPVILRPFPEDPVTENIPLLRIVTPTPCPWIVRFVFAMFVVPDHVIVQLPAGNAIRSPLKAAL